MTSFINCEGCRQHPCQCARIKAEQDRLDNVHPAELERAQQALHAYHAALADLRNRRTA